MSTDLVADLRHNDSYTPMSDVRLKERAANDIERLRAALQSILEKTAAPVNAMAEREAVHFAYSTARRALEETL